MLKHVCGANYCSLFTSTFVETLICCDFDAFVTYLKNNYFKIIKVFVDMAGLLHSMLVKHKNYRYQEDNNVGGTFFR